MRSGEMRRPMATPVSRRLRGHPYSFSGGVQLLCGSLLIHSPAKTVNNAVAAARLAHVVPAGILGAVPIRTDTPSRLTSTAQLFARIRYPDSDTDIHVPTTDVLLQTTPGLWCCGIIAPAGLKMGWSVGGWTSRRCRSR